MSRILVVGASGFLGGHVLEYFSQNSYEVWRGVRGNSPESTTLDDRTIYLDELQNQKCSFGTEFDCVVFCGSANASLIDEDPSEYLRQSVLLPYTWLHSLVRLNTKQIIWVGSYWQEPTGDGYQGTTLYAASKQAMQDLLASFADYGIHINVIHLGDLYGLGDQRKKIIPLLIKSIIDNQQILIHNPEHVMRPVWYLDVLEGLSYLIKTRASRKPGFEVYSMVGPEMIQVRILVKTIIEALDADASLVSYSQSSAPSPYSGLTKYCFPIESFQQTKLRDGVISLKKADKSS
jgi:nucleoside-diphosphate-sugar epimerase